MTALYVPCSLGNLAVTAAYVPYPLDDLDVTVLYVPYSLDSCVRIDAGARLVGFALQVVGLLEGRQPCCRRQGSGFSQEDGTGGTRHHVSKAWF